LSLLFIDIDNFKQVNDTYGHIAGDECIKKVAQGIYSMCRATDMLFRYAGDEFVIILTKTKKAGTIQVAERIRACIEAMEIGAIDNPFKVTLSIGTTTLRKKDDNLSFLDRSDKALYKAKSYGKNRVEYN